MAKEMNNKFVVIKELKKSFEIKFPTKMLL